MEHYSDEKLLDLFQNSDNPAYAFNLLVKKYQEKIYWHIRRMVANHEDANDLVQEVFVKVWIALADFRGDSKLFTWLYRIATNETLSFLKKKNRWSFLPWNDVANALNNQSYDHEGFTGTQIQQELQKAIMRLPEKQRVVFNLRYFDEMKYEEMSKILDTSVGALKASFHHAVKKVEDHLKAT